MTEIDDDNPVSDGGVDTRASPGDLLDESGLSPERFAENTLGLDTLATLLNNPPLTRVYVYICYWGPTTVPEVVEELDLSISRSRRPTSTWIDSSSVNSSTARSRLGRAN